MRSYTILDVFTDRPLEGNPVAVFEDGAGLSTEVMQRTARELNLSETVFVFAPDGEGEDARVRIFTPAAELPFAGHPMLGTAFALAERSGAPVVRLMTGGGLVPVALKRDGGTIVYGEMDQPIPVPEHFTPESALLAALGVERAELPVEAYRNGPVHIYVALDSE
jgi:trans-2,3-dihydro-3-hydroxyanthranilate isomerase